MVIQLVLTQHRQGRQVRLGLDHLELDLVDDDRRGAGCSSPRTVSTGIGDDSGELPRELQPINPLLDAHPVPVWHVRADGEAAAQRRARS
jgi:hypothetical protein